MNKPLSSTSCQTGCWVLAAASGVVVLAVCLFHIELGILASIFMSAVVFIVVGLLLGWIFCSELKPLGQSTQKTDTPKAPEPHNFKALKLGLNEYEYRILEEACRKAGRSKLNFIRHAMLTMADDAGS